MPESTRFSLHHIEAQRCHSLQLSIVPGNLPSGMYQFAVAAVTNDQQTEGLKTADIYPLTFLEAGSLKPRHQQVRPPPGGSRQESFLASFWLLLVASTPPPSVVHRRTVPISGSITTWCSPCAPLYPNLPLCRRTPVIGLGLQDLFPNKVTYTGSG